MADKKDEQLHISNDLLDAMLIGVKTQEDLWRKECIMTDYHLENDEDGRAAGNSRNGHGKKNVQGKFG